MINGKLSLLRGMGYWGSHLRELPNVVAAPAVQARSEPFCPTKKGGGMDDVPSTPVLFALQKPTSGNSNSTWMDDPHENKLSSKQKMNFI